MPWQRFGPGERFTGLPAAEWNLHGEAARRVLEGADPSSAEGELGGELSGVCLTKNESGQARGRFDVLKLGKPIIGPRENPVEFANRITFRGQPIDDDAFHLAILQEPLGKNDIGDALVAGVTWARVKIDPNVAFDPSQRHFATATSDARYLRLADDGPAEILWLHDQDVPEAEDDLTLKHVRMAIVRIPGAPPGDLVAFVLTAKLNCGGHACALTVPLDGSPGKAIRVFDLYGDRSAEPGYIGWAVKTEFTIDGSDPDAPPDPNDPLADCGKRLYYIVEVDHTAIGVEVTLVEKVNDARYKASLTRWFNGRKPETDSQGRIEVWDEDAFFPKKQVGAKGKAIWDPCARRYRLYNCQQWSRLLWAKAYANFCGNQLLVDLAPGVIFALEFSPFNLVPNPLPTQAQNHLALAAKTGDWLILAWSEADNAWIVLQVQHHEVEFLTNLRVDDVFCQFQGKKQKAWVPVCADPGDWVTLFNLIQEEVVTGVSLTGPTGSGGQGGGSQGPCTLALEKKLICMLGAGVPTAPDTIQFIEQEVVIDVAADNDSLFGTSVFVYVPCVTSPTPFEIVPIVDCPTETGSC